MAASTNVIPSVDFQLTTDGDPIGGGTGATLTLDRAIETGPHDRYAGWQDGSYSTRGWQLAFDAYVLQGAGDPPPKLTGADVAVAVGANNLKGLTEVTLALSQEVSEIVNSTTGLARGVAAGTRKATLTIAADYYDPEGTGNAAYEAIVDELLGVTSAGLAITLTVGGIDIAFTALATQGSIEKSGTEQLKKGITLESVGEVLDTTTSAETGMAAVFEAFFGAAADGSDLASTLAVKLATATDDNTEFSGSGLLSDLSIAMPFTGRVSVSGTIQGNGALTRAVTGA